MHLFGDGMGVRVKRLTAALGSAALVAALVAGGFAFASGPFAVAPVSASLAVQQDGTCRGHVTYAIVLNDEEIADEAGPMTGAVEVRAACSAVAALGANVSVDDKGGKLEHSVSGVSAVVLTVDPDGAGPRNAGECDVEVTTAVTFKDKDVAKIFKRAKPVVTARADATCAALRSALSASCWVARGSWPTGVEFPSIPKCS